MPTFPVSINNSAPCSDTLSAPIIHLRRLAGDYLKWGQAGTVWGGPNTWWPDLVGIGPKSTAAVRQATYSRAIAVDALAYESQLLVTTRQSVFEFGFVQQAPAGPSLTSQLEAFRGVVDSAPASSTVTAELVLYSRGFLESAIVADSIEAVYTPRPEHPENQIVAVFDMEQFVIFVNTEQATKFQVQGVKLQVSDPDIIKLKAPGVELKVQEPDIIKLVVQETDFGTS